MTVVILIHKIERFVAFICLSHRICSRSLCAGRGRWLNGSTFIGVYANQNRLASSLILHWSYPLDNQCPPPSSSSVNLFLSSFRATWTQYFLIPDLLIMGNLL